MNRNGSGKAAGSRPLRALGAKLGALLRRIPRSLARSETDEARRTSIIEESEDAITSATLQGVIVSWNSGAERTYGYTAKEAVGRTVWELMRPSGGSDIVAKNVARIRRRERVVPFEAVHHHRSGRRLNVSVSLAPVKDAAGEVVGVSAINRDVTERKAAEEALREAEARYRTLVEQIPAVTYVQELKHNTALYVSPQVEVLTGYSPVDFYSDPTLWYGVVHPDDLKRVAAEDERTDETGEPFRMEYRMCHKDGRVAWVRDEAIMVEDGDGSPRFWQGVLFDITERKRAEQKILFQARLLDTVGQAVVALDLDGRITYWNRFAETLYGWPAREVVGRPASEILTPEDQQGRADEVMSELMAGRNWSGEFEVRRRDGTSFVAMVIDTPVYDEQGNLAGMIGVSTDITERKEAEDALRRSKARFQAVFENAAVGMALVDMEGRLAGSNLALQEMLGYGDEELRSMTWVELTHPDDIDLDRSHFERLVAGELDRYQFEKRYVRKDGRVIWGHLTGSVIGGPEVEPRLMVGMVEDVTERRQAEEALKESEERFRSAFDDAPIGVTLVGHDNRYLRVNRAFCEMLGRTEEELVGVVSSEITHPEDLEATKACMERVLEEDGGGDRKYDLEKRCLHADGRAVWVVLSVSLVRDSRGAPSHYVCQHQDISERKELEQRLERQAFHDPLTDLPNRALFVDRLRQALARMNRRELPVAVLFLDLDNFKIVNDSLGHEAGDRLLAAVAGRLKECVRPEDTLARFGGDEFAVLVEGAPDLEVAERVARRILERLRAPFNIGGRDVFTSASVGIAPATAGHRDSAKLLRNADLAMYGSKRRGKGGYKVFDAGEDDAVLTRLDLGGELRRALKRGEFEIYYHPEVSVETGRIESLEALVRWRHPRRGLLEPGDFLPVAEEVGLLLGIEERVLLEVCRQGRAWQHRRAGHTPVRVCTNISETLFSQTDLVERVAAALRETGLEAQNLSLEIAERIPADGSEATVAKLAALRDLGVGVVIENFGTAYSALAVLRRFPLDFLKIDRSLVAQLDEGSENAAIVEATINLAHALDWAVNAQGVETAGQLARLRKMGTDLAQGYHFTRPVTAEEATALLEQDLRRAGPTA